MARVVVPALRRALVGEVEEIGERNCIDVKAPSWYCSFPRLRMCAPSRGHRSSRACDRCRRYLILMRHRYGDSGLSSLMKLMRRWSTGSG